MVDILQAALNSIPPNVREQSQHKEGDTLDAESYKKMFNTLISGVEMTRHELLNIFKRNGVEAFDSLYTVFDPNFHMALYDVPKSSVSSIPESVLAEFPPQAIIVIDEQKQGFKLKERILRPAQVGIAK